MQYPLLLYIIIIILLHIIKITLFYLETVSYNCTTGFGWSFCWGLGGMHFDNCIWYVLNVLMAQVMHC